MNTVFEKDGKHYEINIGEAIARGILKEVFPLPKTINAGDVFYNKTGTTIIINHSHNGWFLTGRNNFAFDIYHDGKMYMDWELREFLYKNNYIFRRNINRAAMELAQKP